MPLLSARRATRSWPRAWEMSGRGWPFPRGRRRGWPSAVRSCSGCSCGVDCICRDRAIGEHRDDVVGHLDEAAVDVEARLAPLQSADAQLAVTEPADERAAARRDAGFAVEQRQGDEVGRRVEHRRFGRDDDALECRRSVGCVSAMLVLVMLDADAGDSACGRR